MYEIDEFVIMGIIVFIVVISAIFYGLLDEQNNEKEAIGEMMCSEKGLGEFVKFDSDNKVIVCAPSPTDINYDGGIVRVVNKG